MVRANKKRLLFEPRRVVPGRKDEDMKKSIEIEGMNKTVTIETDELRPYTAGDDAYEETAIADDGSCVAYDDASNTWVQLWPSRPEDYPKYDNPGLTLEKFIEEAVCPLSDKNVLIGMTLKYLELSGRTTERDYKLLDDAYRFYCLNIVNEEDTPNVFTNVEALDILFPTGTPLLQFLADYARSILIGTYHSESALLAYMEKYRSPYYI